MSIVKENGFSLLGLDFSPIKGPEGNIEYLCYIEKSDDTSNDCEYDIDQVVENSYKALKGDLL